IGRDDSVVGGEAGRHAAPREVGLRRAVQQQDRRTGAADHPVDRRARCLNGERFESRGETVSRWGRRSLRRKPDSAKGGARHDTQRSLEQFSTIEAHVLNSWWRTNGPLLCTFPVRCARLAGFRIGTSSKHEEQKDVMSFVFSVSSWQRFSGDQNVNWKPN